MDLQKTMEFMLEQQARFEANFAKSSARLDRIERVVAQNNRLVARLASAGVGLRSDVRRHERAINRHEKFLARHEQTMAEIEDKLNALIDIVDKQRRKNWAPKGKETPASAVQLRS